MDTPAALFLPTWPGPAPPSPTLPQTRRAPQGPGLGSTYRCLSATPSLSQLPLLRRGLPTAAADTSWRWDRLGHGRGGTHP